MITTATITTTISGGLDSSDTVYDGPGAYFAQMLRDLPNIRAVWTKFRRGRLDSWVVIDEPDFASEQPIYEAELEYMRLFGSEIDCDFSVIYAFGRPLEDIRPTGSQEHDRARLLEEA